MKNLFILLFCLAVLQQASGQDPAYPPVSPTLQNLTKAEYFIDTDPGFGNGTNIPITAATNLANIPVGVNTSGLSGGPHRLWVRTRTADGKWSLSNFEEFLVDFNPTYPSPPPALQNITKAEYFIDTDPGFGNAVNIPVTAATNLSNIPVTVNTAALNNGIHRLWLRTRTANGRWSLSNVKEFLVDFNPAYPMAPAAPQNLARAEYFIDTDPGFGNGTAIAITPATNLSTVVASVNTSGLSVGVHRVYLRTKSLEGRWGLTAQGDFLVDENPAYPTAPAATGNLVYAEYFFDTDPGWGKGTPIVFSPAVTVANKTIAVTTSGLPDGMHTFFLRTLDDWSITGYKTFVKGSVLPLRLLSFYARNKERSVALEWTTEMESGTLHFDVERSADGVLFSRIGTVTALNRTGRQNYTLDDGQPLEAKSFYRLKQVDKDGSYEYSKVVVVNRGKMPVVELFPNPAGNTVTITLPSGSATQKLVLMDARAQAIKQFNVAPGQTVLTILLEEVPAGTYFIRWQIGSLVIVKQFVKQ